MRARSGACDGGTQRWHPCVGTHLDCRYRPWFLDRHRRRSWSRDRPDKSAGPWPAAKGRADLSMRCGKLLRCSDSRFGQECSVVWVRVSLRGGYCGHSGADWGHPGAGPGFRTHGRCRRRLLDREHPRQPAGNGRNGFDLLHPRTKIERGPDQSWDPDSSQRESLDEVVAAGRANRDRFLRQGRHPRSRLKLTSGIFHRASQRLVFPPIILCLRRK